MSPEIRYNFRHFDHDDDDVRETDTRIWCIISKEYGSDYEGQIQCKVASVHVVADVLFLVQTVSKSVEFSSVSYEDFRLEKIEVDTHFNDVCGKEYEYARNNSHYTRNRRIMMIAAK